MNTEEEICVICLEHFQDPIKLPCSHTFCAKCLANWRPSNVDKEACENTCPKCRAKIPVTKEMINQRTHFKQFRTLLMTCLSSKNEGAIPFIAEMLNFSQEQNQQDFNELKLKAALIAVDEKIARMDELIGENPEILKEVNPVEELPNEIRRAAEKAHTDIVLEWLGEEPIPYERINATSPNKFYRTLLHEAEFIGNLPLMSILLQLGADVNVKSSSGQTPFRQACHEKELHDAARLLLEWGAEIDNDCVDVALKYGRNKKLAKLIQSPLGGRRCELHGLTASPKLNGLTCIALKYLSDSNKYIVRVELTQETVKVKAENLKRRDRTRGDPGRLIQYAGKHEDGACKYAIIPHCFGEEDGEWEDIERNYGDLRKEEWQLSDDPSDVFRGL